MATRDWRRSRSAPMATTGAGGGARGLTKSFGVVTAVDGIDLEIAAGEFFSLLGPSGCGKTTTLRMIAGFERPTVGQILLDGSDVSAVPPARAATSTPSSRATPSSRTSPCATTSPSACATRRSRASEVRRRVREALELVELGELGEPPAAPALRRPAAARRPGPGPGPAARRAAARRAAGRARRENPQAAADRAEGTAGGGRDHVHLRHPRPGGGAQHERPRRRHERAAGSSRSAPRREVYESPGDAYSSPTSSGSRT